MDRDDYFAQTCTAITVPASRTLSAEERRLMTDSARRFFDGLRWVMVNLDTLIKAGQKKRPLCVIWAAELRAEYGIELSAERIRKYHDKWLEVGEKALINKSLCGKAPEKKSLPPAIVDQFWALYLDMKDKASEAAAWRALMAKLVKGEKLNGGITWQSLFFSLHPAADLPAACPWNHHNPPPGWSQSNFAAQPKPSDVVKALALRGMGAAKAVLARQAGVRMEWSSLRIGECYMIDDHDVDFRCIVEGQLVRLRLIVLIEVRSRRVMAYVVRPRLKDEDGTERSISRRDVQHLVAGWLHKYGLPRDYPAYFHCENAAAAITTDFEMILHRVTDGRLIIDRTALYSGVCQMASFRQSGGTPTGKAPIESKFRLFDIELAHVRGATGRNYIHKPEEHQGRLNAASALIKRARALSPMDQSDLAQLTQQGDVKMPFPSLWEAHQEIHLAIQRMDARTWHKMEGFLEVAEFRTDPQGTTFYPLHEALFEQQSKDTQELIKEFLTYPDSLQNRMLSWGRVRAESSAECWLRLLKGVSFVKVSDAGLAELLLDSITAEWPGTGAIRLDIAGDKIEFKGRLEDVLPKTKLRFRFNQDAPSAVWVQDLAGRPLGTLNREDRAHYHDADALKDRAAFKAAELARGIQEVRRYELSSPDAIAALQDNLNTAALMTAFEGPHAAPVPVATIHSETSEALVKEMEGRTLPPAKKETAAARYLRRNKQA
ncbi:hypothetical protein GCM10023213_14320 [Prosthecobacter algae]|uniref:Integrase catalytic domain-containing protein n=1 Tax=Prosthecobacter algae TaxID=1144682 RepID=A0ABP9NZN2_9BACT